MDFSRLKSFYYDCLNYIYPSKCISCGEIIRKNEFLCDYCNFKLPIIDPQKRCIKCGLIKGKCDCKHLIYHFEGLTAPFFNEGVAKQALYKFKFYKKQHYVDFFAQKMALCVVTDFKDIKFDGICFAPMTFKSKIKRGYNQAEDLATALSDILNLPLFYNALAVNGKREVQHYLKSKARFKNIRNHFKGTKKLNGKTILLVDDIKTTGATLDECARQLMFAGAYHVYSITAVAVERKG